MSALVNIRSIASAAVLAAVVGLLTTACGSQTEASQDAFDARGEVAEPRIYPPTDVPVKTVPDRIYPPQDVPVRRAPDRIYPPTNLP
jgi:hypothetical protein